MPQIDLSIIIVNWNTKNLLLDCLNSILLQQIIYETEIIVIDNASTDGSAEAVTEHYQNIKLIRNNFNMGFGSANNIGIRNSLGRYVCLVNSDVRVLPDCFQYLMEFMDENKTVGISGPKTIFPDASLHNTCRKFPSLWNTFCGATCLNKIFPKSNIFSDDQMAFFDHKTIRKVAGLAGSCLMIRKSALDQVGLFDEQFFIYFEETDLCKRFDEAGWDIIYYPGASIIHHHGASSSKDPVRFSVEQMKSQMKYWNKHHGSITVIIFQFILLMQHGFRLILRGIFYIFLLKPRRKEMVRQLLKHYAYLKFILSGKRMTI